jgi:hypothetical protein
VCPHPTHLGQSVLFLTKVKRPDVFLEQSTGRNGLMWRSSSMPTARYGVAWMLSCHSFLACRAADYCLPW